MKMQGRSLLLIAIAMLAALVPFLLLAVGVRAAVEHKTLAQLTAEARTIVVGDVTAMQSHWNDDHTLIFTDVTIRVKQVVKGNSRGREIVIPVPGGQVDDLTAQVSDVPSFAVGQETVLFLRDAYFQVVGWHQGKFTVENGIVLEKQRPLGDFLRQIRQINAALGQGQRPEEIHIGDEPDAPLSPAAAPQITSISPTSGPAKMADAYHAGSCASDSTSFTINGSNLGNTQGTSRVRFWREGGTYYNACISSWSNTVIKGQVPGSVSSGDVNVITSGGTSNGVPFAVTFSYGGASWYTGTMPVTVGYRVNANTSDTAGELTAFNNAANTWNNVASADFNFRYDGTTTKKDTAKDGINVISWVMTDTGSIATNWMWPSLSGNQVVEFDIVFNDKNYTWATDGSATKMDVQNIATHELGHSLHLWDMYGAADNAKTMYGYAANGMTQQRSLEADDIAGISYIYPAAPTGLKASDGTFADRVRLTWNAVPGATGYKVYRNTRNNTSDPLEVIATVAGLTADDLSVQPDKTYWYWVRVKNQYWESKLSTGDSGKSACPTGKFTAKYYNNKTLSGEPYFARCETAPVDYNWGTGAAPGSGPADNFSVRWKGSFAFQAAKYKFTGGGDDGFRMSLDGVWILNDWSNHSYREKTVDRTVTAGNHTVVFEYYEDNKDARAKARWDIYAATPTGLKATDGTYADKIRVTWNAVAGATGYKIYRNTSNSSSTATLVKTLTGTTFDDTNTTDNKTYWYWVKAYNSLGDGGFSNGDSGYR